jgi:hypothetical protein
LGYLKSEFDPLPPLKLKEAAPDETAEEKKKREDANAEMQGGRARRDYDRRYEQAALDKLRDGREPDSGGAAQAAVGRDGSAADGGGAAAFDDLTMSGRDKLLTEQGRRTGRTISALRALSGGRVHPGQPRADAGGAPGLRRSLSRWT